MDLKLTKLNSIKVLERIKAANQTKNIRVIVLATSKAEEGIYLTYNPARTLLLQNLRPSSKVKFV